MLGWISIGECKIKTIQKGHKWLVVVLYIGDALGVSSDTWKGIVHNHLS